MICAPDRQTAVSLINQARHAGAASKPACKELGISLRTYQRWRDTTAIIGDGRTRAVRPAPAHQFSQIERDEILAICNEPAHRSLPPSQIVPKLADEGRYLASESTFYRVLKTAGQANRRGRAKAPRKTVPPKSHCARGPNSVWSWDITFLASCIAGQFFRLYMVMDIYSRKIVAWEVHERECSEYAATLITKACLAEAVSRDQLVLHSDNGAPMKGATMLATLQRLGVVPSFSRPSVSDDNPYSESLFRTLKYTPAYPSNPFQTLEAARQWVHRFVDWYNHEHRHSSLKFVTPAQRHQGEDIAILARRNVVYQTAKSNNPRRWSRSTRNWKPDIEVWLNPIRESKQPNPNLENVA